MGPGRAGDGDGCGFDSVRQLEEGLAGQRVQNRIGTGREVGEGVFQGCANAVELVERGGQFVYVRRGCRYKVSPDVDVFLCVFGQTLVAEALPAGGGEEGRRGLIGAVSVFRVQCYKPLGDEGVYPVLVLPGGDGVGLVEEGRVAAAAEELGRCGCGFLVANQRHLFIGEAVEVDQHPGAAGEGGEGGGLDIAFEQIVHALVDFFDGAAEAIGYALVGAGGG